MDANTRNFALNGTPAESSTEPEPKLNGRDPRGRFSTGNTGRLLHGRYSRQVAQALLPEQVYVLQQLADREGAIAADLGGVDSLSTFERDLIVNYQELHALKTFNVPSMFRSRGRARQQAIDAYMSAVDRQLKIISQLGLRRRQKDVSDLSIEEYVALQQPTDHSAHEEPPA